ncbi:MAG: cytochrome c [Novosphingobium sp.]
MTRTRTLALAAAGVIGLAAVAGTGTLASAAPSASTVVATRQANYKKMGAAMKTLKDELQGSADKDKMVAAARTLAATVRVQNKLFPDGSGPSSGVKTDALPAIWTNRDAFNADMQKAIAEADKLVAIAGSGDKSAIIAQFKATGATCGGCHRQFRADD